MSSRDPKRPNILFVLSDDQGYWALGCAGNAEIRTPNLDALAAGGVRFENFFCTSPVCSPARASLLTGRIPSQHGIHDWIRGGNEPDPHYGPAIDYLAGQTSYTDLLAAAGYECGLSGKWHLGISQTPQKSFGFWRVTPRGGGTYRDAQMIYGDHAVTTQGYLTDVITDNALLFLEQQDMMDRPFYLGVHYTAPHSPWVDQHPQEIVDSYDDCPFASCPQERLLPGTVFYDLHLSQQLARRPADAISVREYLKGYFAAVTAMDAAIGRLLAGLEERGLRENTLVIFMGDNGFNCGHHGIWGKGNVTSPLNLFDTSVKVPAIINHPGRLPAGVVSRALASGYDVRPTLLEYAGVQEWSTARPPGRSLLPILTERPGGGEANDFVVVFDEYGPARMIRTHEWKYIHRYPYGPHELYDLVNDPNENLNLLVDERSYGLPARDRVRRADELRGEMEAWFMRYVDPRIDGARQAVTGRGQLGPVWPGAWPSATFAEREARKVVEHQG